MPNSRILVAFVTALIVSGACGTRIPPYGHGRSGISRADSVLATGRELVLLVWHVDAYGRAGGRLPSTLAPVLEHDPAARPLARDEWGRGIRYTSDSGRMELRSAGSDGSFGTADDVIVLGRLGRNIPCERRDEYRAHGFPDLAPECSNGPGFVLPLCPALESAEHDEKALAPLGDPTLATGRRLVALARRADWHARRIGDPPPSLRAVTGFRKPVDGWGREVRYVSQSSGFEFRSPGADGVFDNRDDVFVSTLLGSTIPCAFRTQQGTLSCTMPPPACPAQSPPSL